MVAGVFQGLVITAAIAFTWKFRPTAAPRPSPAGRGQPAGARRAVVAAVQLLAGHACPQRHSRKHDHGHDHASATRASAQLRLPECRRRPPHHSRPRSKRRRVQSPSRSIGTSLPAGWNRSNTRPPAMASICAPGPQKPVPGNRRIWPKSGQRIEAMSIGYLVEEGEAVICEPDGEVGARPDDE